MAGMIDAVKSSVAKAFGDRTGIMVPQSDGTIVVGGGGGYLFQLSPTGRVYVLDGPARKGKTFEPNTPIAAAIWNEASQLHGIKAPPAIQSMAEQMTLGVPTGQRVGATDKLPNNSAMAAGPKAEPLAEPDDMGAASRVVLGGAMGASRASSAIDAWEASRRKAAAAPARPALPPAKVTMGEPEFEGVRKFQAPGMTPDAETAEPDMTFARSVTGGGTSEEDMAHAYRLQIIMRDNPELRPLLEPEYRKIAASARLGDAVHTRDMGGTR